MESNNRMKPSIPARYHTALVCLILSLSILAVYGQVRSFEFLVYDDNEYVYENSAIQDGLNSKSIVWAFTEIHSSNWHPLTWISHMVDIQLFGMNPGMHHLVNVGYHILNTILLFLSLKYMTGAFWRSAFVAALFALHPLHVESVAWIAERKDVLSTLFGFLAIWAYAKYTASPTIRHYFLVTLLFALSLMAKPMLVTLPFVLLLLGYWPLKRFNGDLSYPDQLVPWFRKMFIEKLPLLLLSVASSLITVFA